MGTATRQDPDSPLQPEFAKGFKQSLTSDRIIRVDMNEKVAANKVTSQNAVNRWQFNAMNIPGIPFGISDHFVWDAESVEVDEVIQPRNGVQLPIVIPQKTVIAWWNMAAMR